MTSKDYKNGKIYCIRNTIDDDIYVGSTTQPLSKRMVKHRCSAHTCPHKQKNTTHMYEFELVEEYPCDNVEQLNRKEGEWTRKLGTLNSKIQGRTRKEYYDDTLDIRKHIIQCECGMSFQQKCIARHLKRREHQDYLKQLEDPTYTVVTPGETCECGGRYTQKDKAKHMKTKLHQNYINTDMSNVICHV